MHAVCTLQQRWAQQPLLLLTLARPATLQNIAGESALAEKMELIEAEKEAKWDFGRMAQTVGRKLKEGAIAAAKGGAVRDPHTCCCCCCHWSGASCCQCVHSLTKCCVYV